MGEYLLGVDIGGTKIAIYGSGKDWKNMYTVPSNINDYDEMIRSAYGAIDTYIRTAGKGILPKIIGVGVKDAVDTNRGIWMSSPSTKNFRAVNLRQEFERRFGIPAVIDNDVHAATLAELKFGIGRKHKDFLYINVGTGIAMGAVINGNLLRGVCNLGGEVGHFSVDALGEECEFCHQRGCVENIAGGGAIVQRLHRAIEEYPDSSLSKICRETEAVNSKNLFLAASRGDKIASQIAEEVFQALLRMSCGLVNTFNPSALIYGGGVMTDGWLLRRLQTEIPAHVIPLSAKALEQISASSIGSDYVGVLGALTLAQVEYQKKTGIELDIRFK